MNKKTPARANVIVLKQMLNLIPPELAARARSFVDEGWTGGFTSCRHPRPEMIVEFHRKKNFEPLSR